MFMLRQAQHSVSFDPSDEGGQHSWSPGRGFQLHLRLVFSGLFSPRGHSIRRLRCCVLVAHESTFLRSLRSTPITELHRYYGRSDSCSAGSSRQMPMSLVCHAPRQVSLIHARGLCDHSASTHPTPSGCRFVTLPFSATGFRHPTGRRSGRAPLGCRLVTHARPYRVRHPAD